MKKRICKRLRSRAGETIAEVLIALLISSLALVILAQMITSASNMVQTSERAMKDYYSGNNKLAKQTENGTSATATLKMGESGTLNTSTSILYFENDKKLGGIDVIAYKAAPKAQNSTSVSGGGGG